MSSIIQIDKVKPAKSPNQKRQGRTALIIVAVIIAFAVGAYFLFMPGQETYMLKEYDSSVVELTDFTLTAQASGTVAIPSQMILLSPQEGYAATLYVAIGDPVVKDQVLAEMTVPDLEDSIEDVEATVTDAKVSLERLQLLNKSTLDAKSRTIDNLQEDVADMEDEVAKYTRLYEINASSKSELEDVQDQYDDAVDALEEAKIDLDETVELQALDVRLSELSIQSSETKLTRLLEQLDESTIRSPIAGEVLEIADEMAVPGSLLEINTSLFTVADPDSAVFELELSEDYTSYIALGDQVAISVNNSNMYGEIITKGKVAQASSDGIGSTITVTVSPLEINESLLLGATAIGTFVLGTDEESMVIPRGPYLTSGSQKYLYVVDGNRAVKTAVTFGEIEGNSVQIVNGVEPGVEVITSSYQGFINFDEITLEGE